MGKNQHSKDTLHICATEWARDHGGHKAKGNTPFAKLPLHCCYLSLQPFANPVGTRTGEVFDAANIIAYLKSYGVSPVSGAKLEVKELMPLRFHRNAEGQLHCPITFKVFGDNSHVVLNAVSGHIYSYDAVDQLNRKNKNWQDLITSQNFKWTDIVVIQSPHDIEQREIAKFHFMRQGQQAQVQAEIDARTNPKLAEEKKEKIRTNAAIDRIYEEKRRLKAEEEKEKEEKAKAEEEANNVPSVPGPDEMVAPRKSERYTDNAAAASFTSTSAPLVKVNELRDLNQQERTQEIYDKVRKGKKKAYVRIVTSLGLLNLELHTDMVPMTCDNFLRHCEKGYYEGTIFHRLVRNFMMQGGDPTGTGRGGQSAFEGGRAFRDEFDSRLQHQGPGILSMANSGKNTNKSQFFVTLKSCPHLDMKHTVFGRVVGNLELLKTLNNLETDEKTEKPKQEVKLQKVEVFKNPFHDAAAEIAAPVVEAKPVDPAAMWFSNHSDPMNGHRNRTSTSVGKYLESHAGAPAIERKRKEPGEKTSLPEEEMVYASVPDKPKKARVAFDFSTW